MEPFPAVRRRIYLALFVLAFLMLLPIAIFYADGWRYVPEVGFFKTGGIFVEVPYGDASITVNGLDQRHSNFIQRSFYINDLAPSAYVVRVDKEGYRSWGRILIVEPQLVTDARALLLPEEITLTPLAVVSAATTTKIVTREIYDSYLAAFATTTPGMASSTIALDISGDIGLFLEDGFLTARWLSERRPPSIFCESPSTCEKEISVKRDGGPVTYAHFFGGGVVYHTKEGGVYFAEVDTRITPVSALILSAPQTDMRVVSGALIIKSGDGLYEVEGL